MSIVIYVFTPYVCMVRYIHLCKWVNVLCRAVDSIKHGACGLVITFDYYYLDQFENIK